MKCFFRMREEVYKQDSSNSHNKNDFSMLVYEELLSSSIENYEKSLELKERKKTRENYEFVKAKLDELKKKKKEEEEKNKKRNNSKIRMVIILTHSEKKKNKTIKIEKKVRVEKVVTDEKIEKNKNKIENKVPLKHYEIEMNSISYQNDKRLMKLVKMRKML